MLYSVFMASVRSEEPCTRAAHGHLKRSLRRFRRETVFLGVLEATGARHALRNCRRCGSTLVEPAAKRVS